MTLRLRLATRLDRWDARRQRVLECVGWPQAWLAEFRAYLRDPRLTLEEFWVRYAMKRLRAQPHLERIRTEAEAAAYYQDHDYLLWRNLVHRRHTPWRRVLATMGSRGHLLEFGCGIAPVTAWVMARRPAWDYDLRDLDGPHSQYAKWRVGSVPGDGHGPYQVITALDVFEHLADPEKAARALADELAPGGYLHWNYVEDAHEDLNLAPPASRAATLAYLDAALEPVWTQDDHRVSKKP